VRPLSPSAIPDQTGRTALVTGANDGLGFHVTANLAARGARVIMACRNLDKAERARRQVLERHGTGELDVVPLDLGNLASVKTCAELVAARYARLDTIVCNGGIMAVPFGLTPDGIEQHMGVNYYGHFALVGRLMPIVRKSAGMRVVTVSSVAEKFGRLELDKPLSADRYNRWRAYSDSKLAILMLAFMLDERFKRQQIDAKGVGAHPGFARTHLRTTRLESERNWFQRLQLHMYDVLSAPVECGVQPLLCAALSPELGGGEYIGLSGLGETRGTPKVTKAQARAYDPALRAALWSRSEQLTGVKV
jgi:NAD(P)-dependent dehydrogenase (short-subunit alcohol dehydrogenase family)